jgi:hypothetical protein
MGVVMEEIGDAVMARGRWTTCTLFSTIVNCGEKRQNHNAFQSNVKIVKRGSMKIEK